MAGAQNIVDLLNLLSTPLPCAFLSPTQNTHPVRAPQLWWGRKLNCAPFPTSGTSGALTPRLAMRIPGEAPLKLSLSSKGKIISLCPLSPQLRPQ